LRKRRLLGEGDEEARVGRRIQRWLTIRCSMESSVRPSLIIPQPALVISSSTFSVVRRDFKKTILCLLLAESRTADHLLAAVPSLPPDSDSPFFVEPAVSYPMILFATTDLVSGPKRVE
jgi:hypothetical protein